MDKLNIKKNALAMCWKTKEGKKFFTQIYIDESFPESLYRSLLGLFRTFAENGLPQYKADTPLETNKGICGIKFWKENNKGNG